MRCVVNGLAAELAWGRQKRLRLTVRGDGSVRVSAPYGTPQSLMENFLVQKQPWIEAQQKCLPPVPHYLDGETLPLWGRAYTLRVRTGKRRSLRLIGDEAVLCVTADDTEARRRETVMAFYRKALQGELALRVPQWEERTGLNCKSCQAYDMSTRFGSCSVRSAALRFSLQLASFPPDCLDYVILHELAHLLYPNHGAAFQAYLDVYMPAWRSIRARMNGRSAPKE